MINEIKIPTYIINLFKQTENLEQIQIQFKDRKEFDIQVIEEAEHTIESVRRWMCICKIIKIAMEKDEEIIILCTHEHEFTEHYNTDKFIDTIYEAHRLGATILLGGINGGLTNLLPLQSGLFWLDTFSGAQFVVIFANLYKIILNEPFLDNDVVDTKFSEITSNKFIIYPMISSQYTIKYSAVNSRMNKIYKVYQNMVLNKKSINYKKSLNHTSK